MIKLHPIKSQASPHWDSLVRVYHESFPIDEQRPVDDIARLIEHDKRFVAYTLTDDKDYFVGLLTTWEFDDFTYIEHFAIDAEVRSQGYGSKALNTFIKQQGKPIVLEAEPPIDDITRRRISFYERNGFTLYDFPYMQPAYTTDSQPVELRLMGTFIQSSTISSSKFSCVVHILHHEVYKCE